MSVMPDEIQAGDFWKVLDRETGEPRNSVVPTNLTGTVWCVVAPIGDHGFQIAVLTHHTVREHKDGTISVLPGDGSSNSILVNGSHSRSFHGYIRNGVWDSV